MPEVQEQNSTFYKVLIALAGIIVCNLLFAMLCAVFNFYDFNYSSFYSVFIFYIFIMSCRLVLPVSIPYEKTGMENLELFATVSPGAASSINNLFHSVFKRPATSPRVTRGELIARGEPLAIGEPVATAEPIGSSTSFV